MNSPSVDIKDMLVVDTGLNLVFMTNLYTVREPTTPINTVTVFDGVSSPPQLTFKKGEDYFYDSVQIRVRNSDYLVGYDIAKAIVSSLHGRGQEIWNGTLYSVIYCSNGPVLIGQDDNGRSLLIINFEIQRRLS